MNVITKPPMSLEWKDAGSITFCENGLLIAPELPDRAGLYCLVFSDNSLYIGEAGNIERRIADYLRYYEASGIESEFRINKALKDFQGATVYLMVGEQFASKSQRCQREHFEIVAEKNVRSVRNGGNLEERIAFLKSEIARLEKKLIPEVSTKDINS